MQGFNWWMILVAGIAMTASAADTKAQQPEKLTVYLTDQASVDPCVKTNAKTLAQQIFKRYGIVLRWKDGRPGPRFDGSIGIELTHNAPSLNLATAHALAHAKLNEGVSIAVFWDRIRYKHNATAVLAHVFVHEITHLLQGVPRHSETGIMKGNWNRVDFAAMAPAETPGTQPLQFEAEDLELIREGLANRKVRAAAAASDSMLRKVGE
jgi:hypothetical protein